MRAIKVFKNILSLTVVILLAMYTILFHVFDYSTAIKEARIKTLNRLRPPNYKPLIAAMKGEEIDKASLGKFIMYYEHVDTLFTDRADLKAMLGFCYFYLEQPKKAVRFYEESIKLNPHHFWSQYNLGLIHFTNGDFESSAIRFESALKTTPQATMKILEESIRVYLPIMQQFLKSEQQVLPEFIKKDFHSAVYLLSLSYYRQGNYEKSLVSVRGGIGSGLDIEGELLSLAGQAAFKMGDIPQAIGFLKQSIEKSPFYLDSYEVLSEVLQKSGKGQAAEMIIQRKKDLVSQGVGQRYSYTPSGLRPF